MIKQTIIGFVAACVPMLAPAAEGTRIQVTGEVIDTWCYYSGVMGPPDATTGSAHHTCALWCAAGGIPVGLLADDGTVYMIMKWKGEANGAGDTLLSVQSRQLTADGIVHERDGINYLFVEEVVEDQGIVRHSHEKFAITPPFAMPKPSK